MQIDQRIKNKAPQKLTQVLKDNIGTYSLF